VMTMVTHQPRNTPMITPATTTMLVTAPTP
jgi:hypothetical protein